LFCWLQDDAVACCRCAFHPVIQQILCHQPQVPRIYGFQDIKRDTLFRSGARTVPYWNNVQRMNRVILKENDFLWEGREVSTIVQQSWKRCQASNLKATENAHDQIISTSRIKEIIRDNHLLFAQVFPCLKGWSLSWRITVAAASPAYGGDIEAGHIQLEGPDVTGDFSFRKQELPSLKESEMEAIKARYGRQEAMSVRKPSCCRSVAILFTENWRSTAFLCLLPGRIYDCFL